MDLNLYGCWEVLNKVSIFVLGFCVFHCIITLKYLLIMSSLWPPCKTKRIAFIAPQFCMHIWLFWFLVNWETDLTDWLTVTYAICLSQLKLQHAELCASQEALWVQYVCVPICMRAYTACIRTCEHVCARSLDYTITLLLQCIHVCV